jgi:putative ABC transport system permease protein
MASLEIGPILRASVRHRSAFVVVVLQLAASFAVLACLLVAASWLGSLGHAPLGFDQQDLIAVESRGVHDSADPGQAERRRRVELAQLAALPEVVAVARLWPALADVDSMPSRLIPLVAGDAPQGKGVIAWTAYTSAGIAQVLNLSVVEGVAVGGPETVVITRGLRELLFGPGVSALGRRIGAHDGLPATVAGVVEDLQLREGFWPFARALMFRFTAPPDLRGERLLLRAVAGHRPSALTAVKAALTPSGPRHVSSVNPLTPSLWPLTRTTDGIRTVLLLLGLSVAAIALIGALAVTSFVVAERRRSIGIRRAVGATRWDIFRYFLVESTITSALGSGLGLGATYALVALTRASLPQALINMGHLAATAVLLWAIATLAALVPAHRAARLSPALAAQRT